jgi:hypothetical protein
MIKNRPHEKASVVLLAVSAANQVTSWEASTCGGTALPNLVNDSAVHSELLLYLTEI